MVRTLAAVVVALAGVVATAYGEEPPLDWSVWQHLPVFNNGRMMPLETFARTTVEEISHRDSPRLDLEGVTPSERDLPQYELARQLFPEGRQRFTAVELLFSWLVEPERWEVVPFLIAEHEQLREEILGLPLVGPQGHRLKYVSPWHVERSMGFRQRIAQLGEAQRVAESRGEKFQLSGVDQKVSDLYRAYNEFRLLTMNPQAEVPRRFLVRLGSAAQSWRLASDSWDQLAQAAENQPVELPEKQIPSLVEQLGTKLEQLSDLNQGDGLTLHTAQRSAAELSALAGELARHANGAKQALFATAAPKEGSSDSLRQLRAHSQALATAADDLGRQADEMQLAVYDSGSALRLVPGLTRAALLKNRDAGDDAHPWISLQLLLLAPDDVVRRFVQPQLVDYPAPAAVAAGATYLETLAAADRVGNPQRTVRRAFLAMAQAYVNRGQNGRAAAFNAASSEFAAAVRQLGHEVEPARRAMVEQEPARFDAELLAATAYPPPGAVDAEVFYYRANPFLWSWVVALGALGCFGLAFGRLRGPMFWSGIALLGVAQLFTIFGFALRVVITGWAPVTNMFETVVFVALVVALLGLWFALQPVLGPGLRNAWRGTSIPWTPEATPLSEEQQRLAHPDSWNGGGWLLLLPRAVMAVGIFSALAVIPYGHGGQAVVALTPRAATANDLTVWAVGLSMLAIAVWLVPRMLLALLMGPVSVPYTLAKGGWARAVEQAQARKAFGIAAAGVAFLAGYVAYFAPVFDKDINPLMPVLRDNFWLTAHVLTITASYGAGALAWGLGNMALRHYLFGRYREPATAVLGEEHRPADGYQAGEKAHVRRGPEACDLLAGFIYKTTQVAVLLLAAGTILGGLWADVSWGRFWGWDSKEVWALISLLVYLAILHGRYAGFLGNFALAAGSVIGATAIVMAWYGVNFVLGSGLHSYGSGAGGLGWVLSVVVANWTMVALAAFRYFLETSRRPSPAEGS